MTLPKRFSFLHRRYFKLYWLAAVLMAGGIALIAVDAASQMSQRKQSQQLKQDLLHIYAAAASPAVIPTSPTLADVQALSAHASPEDEGAQDRWERLRAINQETVGWLRVDGTEVNAPIVQHADNDYYLNVDTAGRKSIYGSIFMDFRSDFQRPQQNIVIYGHNMLDGSMFGSLQSYKNQAFFNEHRFIAVDTPSLSTEWEIFSVYMIDAQKDRVDVDYGSGKGLQQAIDAYRKKSLFPGPELASEPDQLLTLVTCSNETDDTRLVIHAFPKQAKEQPN